MRRAPDVCLMRDPVNRMALGDKRLESRLAGITIGVPDGFCLACSDAGR